MIALSNRQQQLSDIDTDILDTVHRLSFISNSSTGYSSARSSLRSSEDANDQNVNDISTIFVNGCCSNNRQRLPFLIREVSLSESCRQHLLNKSPCNITQLERIAMELLETERCYVNDLYDIIEVCK
jgi:hypothetical protein